MPIELGEELDCGSQPPSWHFSLGNRFIAGTLAVSAFVGGLHLHDLHEIAVSESQIQQIQPQIEEQQLNNQMDAIARNLEPIIP